ncbi:hypothetical protein Q9L42_020870 (plasmid) [Methylomarinum sp. Ch1-1]|uniref:Uncharacterized protein n=1 Tax=Methylomarinum roseum TaxID=3067653 RepID=A0AAU7P0J4_9GAMM|nr:hypothetical protein [Methylomarinum sp. Ch1-1]MDP4518977.1 hypothetical protein [Methylomarinum sp. Ch1-1]MDP4523375.1 hypothetical protein [Methylomarinum sp. Ch1-1]
MQDIQEQLTGNLIRENGSIVGLNRLIRRGRKRGIGDQFKLRIRTTRNSEKDNKYRFTTISIDNHGFDKGFEIAVGKICHWLSLSDGQRSQLMACKKFYQTDADAVKAHNEKEKMLSDQREERLCQKKDRPFMGTDGEERTPSQVRVRDTHQAVPEEFKFSSSMNKMKNALQFFKPRTKC